MRFRIRKVFRTISDFQNMLIFHSLGAHDFFSVNFSIDKECQFPGLCIKRQRNFMRLSVCYPNRAVKSSNPSDVVGQLSPANEKRFPTINPISFCMGLCKNRSIRLGRDPSCNGEIFGVHIEAITDRQLEISGSIETHLRFRFFCNDCLENSKTSHTTPLLFRLQHL